MLSFSATTRGDTARENGKEAQQNRDAYVGQELHNGPDERHMWNARRGATVHVSKHYRNPIRGRTKYVTRNEEEEEEKEWRGSDNR